MKKFLLFILCCLGVLVNTEAAPENLNKYFDTFKNGFINDMWKMYPDWATNNGYHKYDGELIIPNDKDRALQNAFSKKYLDSLKTFTYASLDNNNKTDYHLIQNFLQSTVWALGTAKEFQWNPSIYNVSTSFAYIVNENYQPLDQRLLSIYKKLQNVPAFYAAAKANINHPAKELKELAIQQNEGGLSVFENDLKDSVAASALDDAKKAAIIKRNDAAIAAVKSFTAWLKAFPDAGGRSFRLGKKLYDQQFAFDVQSKYTVDELYNAAVYRKTYLLTQMEEKANLLWSKYFGTEEKPADRLVMIKSVIDTISTEHVQPADFRTSIEAQLPRLEAFIKEKNLVEMDATKPLKVRDEPGYMAGVAGASVSAPGPYEKNVKTYYNVGSLDGWSAEKAESYLREYNKYTLQILNIHEAIPGHYVQLVYSNKVPSIVKSVLSNGSMIEGWAVFSELMMMENGYDESPEMWLMYYKWNLRSVCNTILDISVHTKNMSKQDAMDLLVRQAFQQQTEAEGKWKRVSVTHVQLTSYFNGFYEILKLREAYKKKMGKAYSVKKFNETFLSFGSAPVKYIREMML